MDPKTRVLVHDIHNKLQVVLSASELGHKLMAKRAVSQARWLLELLEEQTNGLPDDIPPIVADVKNTVSLAIGDQGQDSGGATGGLQAEPPTQVLKALAGEAGLLEPGEEGGGVHSGLFLPWVLRTLQGADDELEILGREDSGEPKT